MLRWIKLGLGLFGALIALVILFGLLRPPSHTARTQALYPVAATALWDTLTNFAAWPEWYPEIAGARELPARNGHRVIELTSSWGRVPAELVEFERAQRMRTSLDAGSFRGTWTYDLAPAAGGTMLTVTEHGVVDNPVFRTMMVFMDEHATMLAFHRALGHRLGAEVDAAKIDP